jgi:hypothetical protein
LIISNSVATPTYHSLTTTAGTTAQPMYPSGSCDAPDPTAQRGLTAFAPTAA